MGKNGRSAILGLLQNLINIIEDVQQKKNNINLLAIDQEQFVTVQ